jgi:hypothetical protein
MFHIKKCKCGGTAFALLMDNKLNAACTKCGTVVFNQDINDLEDEKLDNVAFQLLHTA